MQSPTLVLLELLLIALLTWLAIGALLVVILAQRSYEQRLHRPPARRPRW